MLKLLQVRHSAPVNTKDKNGQREEMKGEEYENDLLTGAVCGNTFYHSGSILLLQTGVLGRTSDPPELLDPIFHAKEISAISICNNSQ